MNRRYIDFVPKKSGEGVKVVLPEGRIGDVQADGVMPRPVVAMPVGAGVRDEAEVALPTGKPETTSSAGSTRRRGSIDMVRGGAKRIGSKGARARGAKVGGRGSKVGGAKVGGVGGASVAKAIVTKTTVAKATVRTRATGDEVMLDEVFAVKEKTTPARRPRELDPEEIFEEALIQAKDIDTKKMKIPKSPFVNNAKVTKRPLSGNVYPKKPVVEPKEEPSGPVTIIERPEKDSKARLVATIIITIILGAAAGTVAFLLLPK